MRAFLRPHFVCCFKHVVPRVHLCQCYINSETGEAYDSGLRLSEKPDDNFFHHFA